MSNPKETVRDLDELKPVAKLACITFLEECKKAGIDIFITETYRSQARQNYLYEQGRTREGKKVTWTRNSRHTSRLAWDIAHNAKEPYKDVSVFKKAGQVAKKLGITWGGDWKTPDMPHFEVKATWKLPKGYEKKEETKGSGVKMFAPETSTLKNDFGKFIELAKKEGIITSNEWSIKLKEGRLTDSTATALIASYIRRKEEQK